ncbi:MAG: hypothetical protein JXR68_10240 [Bacteroidales bacterium]|nr:hypothetical protein [Bacteroidales bacterium]
MKKLLLTLILAPMLIFGQSQNPPSIKWKQLSTKNFTVIFPDSIEDYAIETALIIDSVYYHDTKIFINNKPKHINLLLYNQSVVSNAYAALAPRRMVWYTTPPQSLSLTLSPWNKVLSIHEFRHVTQYAKLNDGFTKLGSTIFGQFGQAALLNWSIPSWYMEGDAIFNETKYSNSGRGRMPAFSLPIRTILLNNQKISYEKAHFKSYKTYYPNHYYLGYYMVTYINRHYGEDIWNKILYRSSLFSFWPYTFERSIKKYTGYNVRKTYKKAMHEVDSLWTDQLNKMDITDAQIVNKNKKRVWTNYFDLQYIGGDTLIALKSGLNDKSTIIYLYPDGTEKKIREISSEDISYAKGKIVWTRFTEHIRYGEVSYNDIVIYDVKTKKLEQITKKGKYFSAEISPDGSKIVAIEFSENLIPKIVVFDLTGNIIFTKKINDANNIAQPTWTTDNKGIVFLKTNNSGESMLLLNTDNQQIKTLIPAQWIKIEKPKCQKNHVFFNYDYNGITNIYAYDFITEQIYQVTSRPYAAIQAVVDNNNEYIYFTDYNLKGIDIAKMPFDVSQWKQLSSVQQLQIDYFNSDITKNTLLNINTDFAKNSDTNFIISDYKPSKKIINIHSWTPMISGQNYGMDIYSTDLMNSLDLITSVYGNRKIGSLIASVNLNYNKYFPKFSFGVETGKNGIYLDQEFGKKIDSIETWYQNSASLGITVPLNLSRGIYSRYFEASFSTSFISMTNFEGDYFQDLGLNYTELLNFSGQLYFLNRKYMGHRDIIPRFGQSFVIGANYTPASVGPFGFKFYSYANLYFPGIAKHDAFNITLGLENKNNIATNNYLYSASVNLPRGYNYLYFNHIKKISIDYHFPIAYPDINIPYLLYIKRFRGNIFYDYALVNQSQNAGSLNSIGFELFSDFNILRMEYVTFSAGLRFSYMTDVDKYNFELLSFNIGF